MPFAVAIPHTPSTTKSAAGKSVPTEDEYASDAGVIAKTAAAVTACNWDFRMSRAARYKAATVRAYRIRQTRNATISLVRVARKKKLSRIGNPGGSL